MLLTILLTFSPTLVLASAFAAILAALVLAAFACRFASAAASCTLVRHECPAPRSPMTGTPTVVALVDSTLIATAVKAIRCNFTARTSLKPITKPESMFRAGPL